MATKTKRCRTCRACKRLWRWFSYRLDKGKRFYCEVHEKIIDLGSGCDDWCKKTRSFDFSPQRFDEVENDIKLLKEYLKDVNERLFP